MINLSNINRGVMIVLYTTLSNLSCMLIESDIYSVISLFCSKGYTYSWCYTHHSLLWNWGYNNTDWLYCMLGTNLTQWGLLARCQKAVFHYTSLLKWVTMEQVLTFCLITVWHLQCYVLVFIKLPYGIWYIYFVVWVSHKMPACTSWESLWIWPYTMYNVQANR